MNAASLPQELRALEEQFAALQQTLRERQQADEALRRENTVLRQKLDARARRFFGKQSEQS